MALQQGQVHLLTNVEGSHGGCSKGYNNEGYAHHDLEDQWHSKHIDLNERDYLFTRKRSRALYILLIERAQNCGPALRSRSLARARHFSQSEDQRCNNNNVLDGLLCSSVLTPTYQIY